MCSPASFWLFPVFLLMFINRVFPCVFPDYLQEGGEWLWNITQAGTQTDETQMHSIIFDDYIWDGTVGSGPHHYTYKRECVMHIDGKFLVVEDRPGEVDKYMCIGFIQRSPAVVSLMVSSTSNKPDTRLCDYLVLDDRPLLQHRGTYYEDCAKLGGFYLDIYDKHGQKLCQPKLHSYKTMRLESGCTNLAEERGRGTRPIVFTFHECLAQISEAFLHAQEKLYCRGSWRMGIHNFVILSSKSTDEYKTWCLKYPTSNKGSFNATLFSDVVCESSDVIKESTSYARLSLTQQEVTSYCTDTSSECDKGLQEETCSRTIANNQALKYCRKTCYDCSEQDKGLPCNFGHANGTYSILVNDSLQMITLGDSAILDPLGESYCLEEAKYSVLKYGEHPVIVYSDKGCFPRLYCLFVKSLSPSVIGYKLHRGPLWPNYNLGEGSSALFTKLCDSSEEANRGFDFYAKDWQAAVVTSGELVVRPCDIPGQVFRVETYLHATGDSCVGRLHKPDCTKRQASLISIELVSCTNHSLARSYHFNCLADIPNYDPSGRFRLVKDSLTGKYHCLYVSDNLSEEGGTITILTLKQCTNEGRYNYILDLRLSRERNNPCAVTTPSGRDSTSPGGSTHDKGSGANPTWLSRSLLTGQLICLFSYHLVSKWLIY